MFLIIFDDENDLESILDGRPWLFRRKVVLFDRITEAMDRKKIRLLMSPYWVRIGPYPPECDPKELMYAIDSTFDSLLRSKVKSDYCRIQVMLNVKKVLRRGIFVVLNGGDENWVPFKYENLPVFCYGCGVMDHNLQECVTVASSLKELSEEAYPFSLALRVESNMVGRRVFVLELQIANR